MNALSFSSKRKGLFSVLFALLLISCGGTATDDGSGGRRQGFLGAGATFPFPLYARMFDVYSNQFQVEVNYQSIGSGGGIRQLLERTVDFGATDAFMTDSELDSAPAPVLHLPTCLGAVVVTYSLDGNPELKLTPELISTIFLGEVTSWDDPMVREVNPDINLPALDISVVHRSDGSGTTFVFSDYLARVSPRWKDEVGAGKALSWPIGLGAKGNPGVAGLVKQTPGAIGYVELTYALQNDMPFAQVRNRSGNFVSPSIESVSVAADVDLPDDTRVSIADTSAPQGYPISSFTWLIFYQDQNYGNRDLDHARQLARLFQWVIRDGQRYAEPLHYAPLPDAAVEKGEAILDLLVYGDEKLQ